MSDTDPGRGLWALSRPASAVAAAALGAVGVVALAAAWMLAAVGRAVWRRRRLRGAVGLLSAGTVLVVAAGHPLAVYAGALLATGGYTWLAFRAAQGVLLTAAVGIRMVAGGRVPTAQVDGRTSRARPATDGEAESVAA